MISTSTKYAGIELKNPVIAASSGLTSNVKKIRELADAGVAAVVLKSLFEEQIEMQGDAMLAHTDYPEAADYIAEYVKGEEVSKYLGLIREAKAATNIPIIASINCFRADAWANFAKSIEEAGADAVELNIMRLETDLYFDTEQHHRIYTDIVESIAGLIKIPVTIKLSANFAPIPALIDKLRASGAAGAVLFNRSYRTDVDVEQEKLCSGNVFTTSADLHDTLRFIGISSALVPNISYAASSGIHSWEDVVKCLLVGASATEVCSALYQDGAATVGSLLKGLEDWMQRKGYRSIGEFRGRLNAGDVKSATMFERMQFMKYFSRHE